MSFSLQRMTTQYVELEDRVRIDGESAEGQILVLWLTQRLLNRLVPYLCQWLERQMASTLALADFKEQAERQEMMQSFAQQAARAQLESSAPVLAQSPLASWRVGSLDITAGDAILTLIFKGDAGETAQLTLPVQELRQWLAIVCDQYVRGSWSMDLWPRWMLEDNNKPREHILSVLH